MSQFFKKYEYNYAILYTYTVFFSQRYEKSSSMEIIKGSTKVTNKKNILMKYLRRYSSLQI